MGMVRTNGLFRRVDAFEYAWCLRFNRSCRTPTVRQAFAVVSRLGDGVFWYALMALLPLLYGRAGLHVSLQMIGVGAVGLGLYKWLKSRLVRERPCVSLLGIVQGTVPLDRYSFPSGHTLHAVGFATLVSVQFPALAWLCMPFAMLVALSRVVLGLHYPSDVLAGAAIGATLAWLAIEFVP